VDASLDRFVQSGAIRLRVRELPGRDGLALVLLHGFGDSLEAWDGVLRELSTPVHAVRFDLRGHGESGWPPDGDYSPEATVRDLDTVLRALHLERVLLAGHSTGGMTALVYAATQPSSLAGLALLDVDPFAFKDGLERLLAFRGPESAPSFDAFVDRLLAAGDRRPRAEVRRWLRPRLQRGEAGEWTWKQDPRLRPATNLSPARPRPDLDVEAMLGRLACPLVLIRGERSRACTAGGAARTLASCRAPASSIDIPAVGHALLADAAPEVARHLGAFFASLERDHLISPR
jgi:pimeloyl-ACP methyl ester carboxylesterase